MGRPARIQLAGGCYYISLDGNNRQDIFLSNQDRRYFLSLLKAYKDRCRLKVYAYCLMPNYARLLLETSDPNLAMVMQGFGTQYTKYFHAQRNTSGHVFQGRYKALLVDKEHYLTEMTSFVHLEPLRAGLKDKPWRYQWSSGSAYVESELRDALVDSGAVLKRFGKVRLAQSVRYLQFLKDRVKTFAHTEPPVVKGAFIGSEAFAARVLGEPAGAGEPPAAAPQLVEKILSEVSAKHRLDRDRLVGRSQWREVSAARKEAIHRVWKEARLGITEIGRLFQRTPSAISQLIRALEAPGGVI
jgi:putative transposase